MTKEILKARLTELRQIMANAQANLNAMRGQEIEIKFWIEQFEQTELQEAQTKVKESISLVKAVEDPAS